MNRLNQYPSPEALPHEFTASLLGLTDKADGSKRRIHHLSFPAESPTSINSGIPEEYGAIRYSSISDATSAIRALGKGCLLVKRDFESAFRHIPISPIDSPLLGFEWAGTYYSERFLPFGLPTAPYLFNLFAELFHWILADSLNTLNREASVIHYLDDFLIVLPPHGNGIDCGSTFAELSSEVGLSIKVAKNEEGTTASFGGVEFNTIAMVIRLPTRKLHKACQLVEAAISQHSLSLVELQTLTGYLNFIAIMVPLGRTFLRRLYNMQLFFHPGRRTRRRRVSTEATKDLRWWTSALATKPELCIARQEREIVMLWSDAVGTKGLGAFFIDKRQRACRPSSSAHNQDATTQPYPEAAFSIALPKYIMRKREHINTKEMCAVEQSLLYWGKHWRGTKVIMNIDNRAVVYGLENSTIRGATMNVLRRCLLLATNHDLEIEAQWIPTNENALADALSHFAYDKIADLAPQLLYPISSLRDLGFLTSSKQDSHQ